jgi:hypothetical protein
MKTGVVTHKNGRQTVVLGRYDILGRATHYSGSSITFVLKSNKELCNPDSITKFLCVITGRTSNKRNFAVDLEKNTITPLIPQTKWPDLLNKEEVLRLARGVAETTLT